MYHALLLLFLLVLLIGAALRRGQRPEREATMLFVAAGIASKFVEPRTPTIDQTVVFGLLLIDLGVLIGLAAIALRHRRRWAMIAASLQIISTLAHFARFLDASMDTVTYAVMESASSLPQVLLLAIAIWRHPRPRLRSSPAFWRDMSTSRRARRKR